MIFVPGMFYDQTKDVGGNGQFVRDIATEMGMQEMLVPVLPAGTVDENGRIFCDFLETIRPGRKVLVTSISKGSADFKRALAFCGNKPVFRKVKAWLNIAGLNRGTYLANEIYDDFSDRMQSKLFFYANDYDYDGVRKLMVDPKSPLYADPVLPEHLRVINVFPATLYRHVSEKTDETFQRLIPYGPNDGYTVSADSYLPGVTNLAIWGVDHFFALRDEKKVLLLKMAFSLLMNPG